MFTNIVRNIDFYDLEKPSAFGIPNQILWDTSTLLFTTLTTETVLGKPG
jgi:hypothetical protein